MKGATDKHSSPATPPETPEKAPVLPPRELFELLAAGLSELRRDGVERALLEEETLAAVRAAAARILRATGVAAAAGGAVATASRSGAGELPRYAAAPAPACVLNEPSSPAATPKSPPIPSSPPDLNGLPDANSTKRARLNWLRARLDADPVCNAHKRPDKKLVFGTGSEDASIFFCGEAPGAEEETQGEPFVGPAGQLLTKIIAAMGLSREQVYIANIMKWRPEMPSLFDNRPPTPEEMAYCLPFLRAQIDIIRPKVIVALGGTAITGLLAPPEPVVIRTLHGQWREFAGIPLMPTYHPSYLLRSNSNASKRVVWEDLLKVMEHLRYPISPRQRNYFLPPR
ncbi:MAG: uracil-DNA glycosylase [Puniceicoccales bacterium]|jgi:DNA polymerase|nr:uracil-DNA glycosylase [Puniceicoccales bacterium]